METTASKYNMRPSMVNDLNSKIDYGLMRDVRVDVTEVKSTLKQIQKEQLFSAATLGTLDDALKEVWARIRGLDAALPNLVTVETLDLLKQDFVVSLEKLQRLLDTNQETFRCALGLNVDAKLDKISAWFNQVEDSLKIKQQRLFSQLEYLAQECDLAALRENVREDFFHFQKRLDFLDKNLELQYGSIKSVKIKNSLRALASVFCSKQTQSIKQSWKKWESFVKCYRQMKESEAIKAQTMRKLMLRTCFGRKEKAWKTWCQLIQDMISIEKQRLKASALLLQTLQQSCSLSLKGAFRRWHRLSVWEQRMAHFDEPFDLERFHSEQPRQSRNLESSLRFRLAMSSLKNDHEGAILILSNELCNIRSLDLNCIVKEMRSGDQSLQNKLDVDLQSIQDKFQKSITELEEKMSKESVKNDEMISDLKKTFEAMQNHLFHAIHKAEAVDELHTQQIQSTLKVVDALLEKEKSVDHDMERIKETIAMLDMQNSTLQKAHHHLEEKLHKHEEMTNQMKANFQVIIYQLQSKLADQFKRTDNHSLIMNQTVDSLGNLKMDYMQLKIKMDERFDGMTDSINAYGIRKPNMAIIIRDCLAYEKQSKERNYIVNFNRISAGQDEIDLAADIASFAYDYATWIAFQVDHEVLQSIIIGQNPEDLVYANDESGERRNSFVAKLRSTLETVLDEAFPHAGTQRMEARMKFISRVIEATETTLSKYDQVLVPISARLAKVRASVPTCMACDRPLRVKERSIHPQNMGSNGKAGANHTTIGSSRNSGVILSYNHDYNMAESMESKTQTLNCILSSAATGNSIPSSDSDSTNYVMRGGFKMPLAHRT